MLSQFTGRSTVPEFSCIRPISAVGADTKSSSGDKRSKDDGSGSDRISTGSTGFQSGNCGIVPGRDDPAFYRAFALHCRAKHSGAESGSIDGLVGQSTGKLYG